MKIAPLDSPTRTAPRQEAAKHESAPQPEAKSPDQGLGYISPVIHVDSESGVAILQYRDNTSGDVTVQFPSETVVKRYREGEVVAHHGQAPSTDAKPASTDDGGTSAAPAPAPAPATGGDGGSGGETATGGGGSGGGTSAKG